MTIKPSTETKKFRSELGSAILIMLAIVNGVAVFLILFNLVNACTGFKQIVGSIALAFAAYSFIVSVYNGNKRP